MSSTGSSGPERSISSIRTGGGSNTDDVFELGRRLAAHFDRHDTIRHWMAHHLAQLIAAAEDDSTATPEQRQQVIDMILKIWSYRHHFPDGSPLEGYAEVFAALRSLSHEAPSRLEQLLGGGLLDAKTRALPLVAAIVELENLIHDTVETLICLAAEDARETNAAWLHIADKVAQNVESRVTRDLQRLHRRRAYRLQDDDAEWATPNEPAAELSSQADTTHVALDGGFDVSVADKSVIDDIETLPNSITQGDAIGDGPTTRHHAGRLRAMASLLNDVADRLLEEDAPAADSK